RPAAGVPRGRGGGLPPLARAHGRVSGFVVRPARVEDARPMAELLAEVAAERDGIATEPPVDVDERAELFGRSVRSTFVTDGDGRLVGMLHVEVSRFGFGELGMCVDRDWRGRGVGTALVQAAV